MDEIDFDPDGLVPCVMQDAGTGEVLTLAYMNADALARTRETGEVHFWSRSRKELWRKGETSGNTMTVRALRYDCDADALVALVDPAGPACHTGERTCFYRGDMEPTAEEALPALERTIAERKAGRRHRSPATQPSCWPIPLSRPRRSTRRPRRSPAPRARSPTSGWPRRPPTCCTT